MSPLTQDLLTYPHIICADNIVLTIYYTALVPSCLQIFGRTRTRAHSWARITLIWRLSIRERSVPRGGSLKFGVDRRGSRSGLYAVRGVALRPPYSSSKLTHNHNVILSTASAHRACFQRAGWDYSPYCKSRRFRPTGLAPHQHPVSTSGGLGCLALPGSRERPVAHGHVLSCRQVVRPWRSFRSHPETAARPLRYKCSASPTAASTSGGPWSRGAQIHQSLGRKAGMDHSSRHERA